MPEEVNVFKRNLENQPVETLRVMHSSDLPVGVVDQRHLAGNLKVVEFSATRPDGSSDIKAHFNTSSGVLSCWTGTEWLTTTLA